MSADNYVECESATVLAKMSGHLLLPCKVSCQTEDRDENKHEIEDSIGP